MTEPDPTMNDITAAVTRGREGDPQGARTALTALWEETADPLHRCTIAHFLADLQDAPEEELAWDERALAAVAELTDERLQRYDKSFQVRAFLPSLHLSLADDHRRRGAFEVAAEHLAAGEAALDALNADAYGDVVRGAAKAIHEALAARSTEPLTPA